MSVEELIDGMLEGFEGGRRWCQGYLARDGRGQRINFDHPSAASFCLRGMVGRVILDHGGLGQHHNLQTQGAFEDRLIRAIDTIDIVGWNDSRESFGEVKAALEAAREGGK